MLLVGACVYVGILNREKAYFYAAAALLAVMVCLLVGLAARAAGTQVQMHVDIPVAEKNAGFHPALSVCTASGPLPYVSAEFRVVASGMRKRCKGSFRQLDVCTGRCEGNMSLGVSGRYEIKAVRVRVYDALHIFYVKRRIDDTAYIYVVPQCYMVPVNVTKNTRDFVTDSDVYYADVRGDDISEIYQVREYREGDRLMNIHWKLTARQDELMVREASRAMSCPVILCVNLDGRDCRSYGQSMSALLETMVSVSFSLIQVRVPHFIAWYDPESSEITRYRIMREEDVYDAAATMSFVDARQSGRYDIIGMYRDKYRGEDFTTLIDMDMKGGVVCGADAFCVHFRTFREDLEQICLTV